MVGPGVVDGDVAVLVGHVGTQGREDLEEAGNIERNCESTVKPNLVPSIKNIPLVAALISVVYVKTECDLEQCKNIAVIIRDNLLLSSTKCCNSMRLHHLAGGSTGPGYSQLRFH